ncbi:hypothetical protein, partial [Vibrio vulnificus]|uniref:hypothetical protein n=1 Tax=Vibrio vulnificus TaxID=672 RepID=UPI001EECC741
PPPPPPPPPPPDHYKRDRLHAKLSVLTCGFSFIIRSKAAGEPLHTIPVSLATEPSTVKVSPLSLLPKFSWQTER